MVTKRAKKTDVDVVNASSAELRKAVEAIAIQPKSGKITLLTRKLFNVLLAVAQQADDSGDTYRALLSDIVANSAFDSNDTALVKEHLRRMVSVQVEWSTGTSSQKPGRKWGISTLIADAEILEDPTTRRVWVEFSFAPKIKKKLLDPVQYARLSLQFQSQLRSSAGLALYEICVRYLTNPSHLTMREPWEWWRPILSGTPDTEAGDEAKREYKYFKRDYLRPAIAEVNAVTNIFVELIEHREGRRVAEIQFRVSERKQPMLALDEHPNVFDSTLVDRMVKLGIPLKEAQTLYADSEENRDSRGTPDDRAAYAQHHPAAGTQCRGAVQGCAEEGLCPAGRPGCAAGYNGRGQAGVGGIRGGFARRSEGAAARRIRRLPPQGSKIALRGTGPGRAGFGTAIVRDRCAAGSWFASAR